MPDSQSFLYNLFKTSPLYGRIKISEEHRECIRFSNFCKASSLDGSLKGIWFHVANETGDNTKKVFGALLRSMGKICGIADYVFLSKNGCGCIEFKTEARYKSKEYGLSDSQQLFKRWCEKQEIPYVVVCKTEEAIEFLKEWKIIE